MLHRQCVIKMNSYSPRFLTEDLKDMCLPPELRQEAEALGRTSVFSALSLSLLLYIQL